MKGSICTPAANCTPASVPTMISRSPESGHSSSFQRPRSFSVSGQMMAISQATGTRQTKMRAHPVPFASVAAAEGAASFFLLRREAFASAVFLRRDGRFAARPHLARRSPRRRADRGREEERRSQEGDLLRREAEGEEPSYQVEVQRAALRSDSATCRSTRPSVQTAM